MKPIFILLILAPLTILGQTDFKIRYIDVRGKDTFELSKISNNIISVPLEKTDGIDIIKILKPVLTQKYIYALTGSKETKGNAEKAVQFTRDGKFVKQLQIPVGQTKSPPKAIDLQYLYSDNKIMVRYEDATCGVFGMDGNFEYSLNDAPKGFMYNNGIYYVQNSFDFKNAITNYFLTFYDIKNKQTDTLYTYMQKLPKDLAISGSGIAAIPTFSVVDDRFFFIQKVDEKILEIIDNKIIPHYQFKFKNARQNEYDVFVKPHCFIFRNYIYYGYRDNRQYYCYLFNTLTGNGYNIQLLQENYKILSGLSDDILNTGYVELYPTNCNNYLYFTKTNNEIDNNSSINSYLSIFFVEL